MSVSPLENTIEVECGAEDVAVTVMHGLGVSTVMFDHCPWTGYVTEYVYTHAGIAEWSCPLCNSAHSRDLR